MTGNHRYLGAILGGLVALAAMAFLLSGGELGGNKKIAGDRDLPPVETTGSQQQSGPK